MSKWQSIHNAVMSLAGHCDGASSLDGAGFNRFDAPRGRAWALQPELTAAQARNAHATLRKYQKQLERLGIDYAALVAPTDADIETARPAGQHPAQPTGKLIDAENDHFKIIHPFSVAKEMIPHLAIFPRRRFERQPFAHWRVPVEIASASRLMEFAIEHDYQITEAATAAYDRMLAAALTAGISPDSAQVQHADRYMEDGRDKRGRRAILIYFTPGADFRELYDAVSRLEDALFNGTVPRHWAVKESAQNAPALLELGAERGFSIPAPIKARLEALVAAERKAEAEAGLRKKVLMSGALDITTASFGGKTPRAYQAAGVSFLLENERALLADDMGLGKTFQAMLWARAFKRAFRASVFIIAPKALRGGWAKEAQACGVPVEIYTWAKIAKPPARPFVLIADEAHFAQSMKAARTKAMLELAESPHCLGALMVSGTPMRGGRPINVFPLLKAVRHPLGKDQRKFEKYYCNAHDNGFGWDTTGAAHLDELMEQIKPIMLRRLKKDVLKDLPPKQRIVRPVEISPNAAKLYKEAFDKAQREYIQRKLATKEKIARGEKLDKNDVQDGGEALVMLTHLRRAGSIAKVECAIDLADEILDQGRQIIIFTEFADSAQAMAAHYRNKRFGVELLTGEAKDRDAMIERFQTGKSRVWISTIKAGGVGLTLTAASDVVLLDRPWMIDDAQQAEDRVHRKDEVMEGRMKESPDVKVTTYWLQGFEVDQKIDARLFEQEKVLGNVMAGDRKTLRGVKTVHQLAQEIADELFTTKAMAA